MKFQRNSTKVKVSYTPNIFLIIFLLSLLILVLWLLYEGFLIISPKNFLVINSSESVRYLLSAEIQAQATVIAIIVSLTLVAVQLASQSYSSRIVELFIRDKWLWRLLAFYSFSISYNIFILSFVKDNARSLENLLRYVEFSMFLMIVSLILIFLYIKHALEILKPQNIIGAFTEKISIKKLKSDIDNLAPSDKIVFKTFSEEYSLTPLIDIVKASIRKNDYIIAKYGLDNIQKTSKQILEDFRNSDKESITKYLNFFFGSICDIYEISLLKKDEELFKKIILCLNKIIMKACENNKYARELLPEISGEIYVKNFLPVVLKNNWNTVLKEIINTHFEFADIAINYDMKESLEGIILNLIYIGKSIQKRTKEEYQQLACDISNKLGEYLKCTVKKEDMTTISAEILNYIKNILEKNLCLPLKGLENSAKILIDKNFHDWNSWWYNKWYERYLLDLYYTAGEIVAEKKYGIPLKRIIISLENIALYAISTIQKKDEYCEEVKNEVIEKIIVPIVRVLTDIAYIDIKAGANNTDLFLKVFNNIERRCFMRIEKIEYSIKSIAKKVIDTICRTYSSHEKDDTEIYDFCKTLKDFEKYGYKRYVDKIFDEYEDKLKKGEISVIHINKNFIINFKKLKECYNKKY